MNEFHVLDRLILSEGSLFRKAGKSYKPAHFRQGDLDGACGAYSVAIALNMLGVFDASAACLSDNERKNPAEESLVRAINRHGLYRRGLSQRQLLNLLKLYSDKISYSIMNEDDMAFVSEIAKTIAANNPIILGIDFSGGGHWLVVVGYVTDERSAITHLLTLDPGYDSPKSAMWNGIIDLEKVARAKYPYVYQTMDNTRVKLTSYISIIKK